MKLLLYIELVILCALASKSMSMIEEHKPPTYLQGRVGGSVVFNCPLEFPNDFPIPYHLYWRKDNKLIFAWYGAESQTSERYANRIYLAVNDIGLGIASINLTMIQEEDIGFYECKISYPNRSPQMRQNGTWFHLSVDGLSLLKIPPTNQTVLEFEPAFFHCTPKDPDTKITWYKDGELLTTFQDLKQRCVIGEDGSLLIKPTIMTDLGFYECRVKSKLGEEEFVQAFLNVQYKAKIVFAPAEAFFAFGQQAILDCHFRSNPPLIRLRWEKDGFLFDPYNVKDVFFKRNGSLFFSIVDDSHSGKYTCTPFNSLGTQGPSSIIRVFVQHPPEFILKPKSVYLQKLNDTLTIPCVAQDKHADTDRTAVTWRRKEGIPLPFNRHSLAGGNLTIQNVTADDRGVYVCSAINEAATIQTDVELMIETFSPKAPSNLTATSSKNSITIRWTQNYVRADMKFSIWYRLADLPEWRTHNVIFNDKYESTIDNLEPGREYEFMVLSQDRFSDFIGSKPFRFRTKPADYSESEEHASAFSQIGPPRNVTVEELPGGFLVQWEEPEYGQGLGLYIIRWFLEPEHKLHGQAETRNTNYTVPDSALEDGVWYSFQVSSVSTNNYEAYSAEFEIFTPHYRVVQVVTIAAVCLLILLALAGIIFYLKRHLFTHEYEEAKV